ncbi:hypothetical protein [Halovivax gelatinilyticus]|uniref:hypothetical protein n=1 Tax=Halovivax gelatinilyticus TaxID=2961597 RepID=UPI0020CA9931|nr:hypothetical protein [Halovivax gelatinilyticus]
MSTDETNRSERRTTVSRRGVLAASGGAFAVAAGRVGASEGESSVSGRLSGRCPDATIRPSHGHCDGATMDGCADDHPETIAIQTEVKEVLDERYETVGDIVDDGFFPYFDTLDRSADGWSHWINPDYVGDDSILDPDRPESILVDNHSWRAIGVMFVATIDGEPVEPPSLYGEGEPDENRCSPWHYHAGLPGRKAWWYYENVHDGDGLPSSRLPCRTPCMMHVWTVEHPDGVHAHGGPPPEYRDEPVATETGLDTAAVPGEDTLGWETLPDAVVRSHRGRRSE